MDGLVEYIRAYNKAHPFRLHIWTATPRTAGQKLPSEVIVRFTIRDVVTVYLTLGSIPPEGVIVVEGATAFGPREKVRMKRSRRDKDRPAMNTLLIANNVLLETAALAIKLCRVSAIIAAPG